MGDSVLVEGNFITRVHQRPRRRPGIFSKSLPVHDIPMVKELFGGSMAGATDIVNRLARIPSKEKGGQM